MKIRGTVYVKDKPKSIHVLRKWGMRIDSLREVGARWDHKCELGGCYKQKEWLMLNRLKQKLSMRQTYCIINMSTYYIKYTYTGSTKKNRCRMEFAHLKKFRSTVYLIFQQGRRFPEFQSAKIPFHLSLTEKKYCVYLIVYIYKNDIYI